MRKNVLIIFALMMLSACCGRQTQTESAGAADADSTEVMAPKETDSMASHAQSYNLTGTIGEDKASMVLDKNGIDVTGVVTRCDYCVPINVEGTWQGDNISFFTENQNTTITGDYQDMPHWSITGCPTMNALNAHHQESLKQFEDPIMALATEIEKAGAAGDTMRVLELSSQLQPLIESYMNSEIEFIRSHSGDYLGHFLLDQSKEELDPATIKELADSFTSESVYSRRVKEYLNASSEQMVDK